MKTGLISLLFLLSMVGAASGQNISFTYDADGNMTSRYVVILKSSKAAVEEAAEEATEEATTEEASESTLADVTAVDFLDKKISIYPNPTRGRIIVEILPFKTGKNNILRLYEMNGNLILSQTIVSERSELEITGLPGIYLLDILLDDQLSRWKIIKQ